MKESTYLQGKLVRVILDCDKEFEGFVVEQTEKFILLEYKTGETSMVLTKRIIAYEFVDSPVEQEVETRVYAGQPKPMSPPEPERQQVSTHQLFQLLDGGNKKQSSSIVDYLPERAEPGQYGGGTGVSLPSDILMQQSDPHLEEQTYPVDFGVDMTVSATGEERTYGEEDTDDSKEQDQEV